MGDLNTEAGYNCDGGKKKMIKFFRMNSSGSTG